MNPLILVFFCGIIAFLLGALIIILSDFANCVLSVASAFARGNVYRRTWKDYALRIVGWVLLVLGGISTLVAVMGYVLKSLNLI